MDKSTQIHFAELTLEVSLREGFVTICPRCHDHLILKYLELCDWVDKEGQFSGEGKAEIESDLKLKGVKDSAIRCGTGRSSAIQQVYVCEECAGEIEVDELTYLGDWPRI